MQIIWMSQCWIFHLKLHTTYNTPLVTTITRNVCIEEFNQKQIPQPYYMCGAPALAGAILVIPQPVIVNFGSNKTKEKQCRLVCSSPRQISSWRAHIMCARSPEIHWQDDVYEVLEEDVRTQKVMRNAYTYYVLCWWKSKNVFAESRIAHML